MWAVFATLVVAGLWKQEVSASELGSDDALHPILFAGGLGASMMRADVNKDSAPHWFCSKQTNDYDLWLYYRDFLPGKVDCWLDNMRLRWSDGKLQDFGVKTKLVGDQLASDEDIADGYPKDLFGDLLHSVADHGYSGTSSFVGALHFDWRLGPNELAIDGTYEKMRAKIESYVNRSNGKKAVLVTLSYGAPVMHKFLTTFMDAAWQNKYIERWITLSGTFGGSAELTRMSFYPTANDFYNLPAFLPYISLETLRDMTNTFPSAFIQTPTFMGSDEVLIDVTTEAGRVQYTQNDLGKALVDAGFPDARSVFDAQNSAYDFATLPAPSVPVDCIYGIGDDTVKSMIFGHGFGQPATDYMYEDGDAVAPTRSLQRCTEWNRSTSVSVHAFPHIGHGGTLHSPEATAAFSGIIRSLYTDMGTNSVLVV